MTEHEVIHIRKAVISSLITAVFAAIFTGVGFYYSTNASIANIDNAAKRLENNMDHKVDHREFDQHRIDVCRQLEEVRKTLVRIDEKVDRLVERNNR